MSKENVLFLIIGALLVMVAVLAYQVYEQRYLTSEPQTSAGDTNILIEGISRPERPT